MRCNECNRDMELVHIENGIEIWKCKICDKEVVNNPNNPIVKETDEKDISNLIESQGKFGKLRPVKSVRKPFECRICEKSFEIGSPGYTQSDHTGDGLFPKQTRVCDNCGKELINNGTEVKK